MSNENQVLAALAGTSEQDQRSFMRLQQLTDLTAEVLEKRLLPLIQQGLVKCKRDINKATNNLSYWRTTQAEREAVQTATVPATAQEEANAPAPNEPPQVIDDTGIVAVPIDKSKTKAYWMLTMIEKNPRISMGKLSTFHGSTCTQKSLEPYLKNKTVIKHSEKWPATYELKAGMSATEVYASVSHGHGTPKRKKATAAPAKPTVKQSMQPPVDDSPVLDLTADHDANSKPAHAPQSATQDNADQVAQLRQEVIEDCANGILLDIPSFIEQKQNLDQAYKALNDSFAQFAVTQDKTVLIKQGDTEINLTHADSQTLVKFLDQARWLLQPIEGEAN